MNYLEPTDEMWGLDVEGNGLSPTKLWCVCLINLKSGEQVHFTDKKAFKDWLKPEYNFVTHNGLKWDVHWLKALWKVNIQYERVVDTLVLSQLFDPNLPKPDGVSGDAGTHSLEAWGVRVKLNKIDHQDFSEFSEAMLKYCFRDVKITLKVYKQLVKKLKAAKFSELSCSIEHGVAPIIGEQQRNGFAFDKSGAISLRDKLRRKQTKLEADIHKLFPPRLASKGVYNYRTTKLGRPYASFSKHTERYAKIEHKDDGTYECFDFDPFNIGSSSQRLERLIELGYKPTLFTKKGNPKVDEDALLEFSKTVDIEELKFIAEWLMLEGRANMIQTWLDNLGDDDCIHGNVMTCGAQSRRMKHSAPNTANIPQSEKPYGKDVRRLWIARNGRVLVGVDASGLEARMLTHHLFNYIWDEAIRKQVYKLFVDGKPHKFNSDNLIIAGIECTYHDAKQLFYAFLYGAGDAKLGAMLKGQSASVGARIREVLINTVPGLAVLLEAIKTEWKTNGGILQCIDGGYVRCPSKSAALNYKLQPDGAIFMKQAKIIANKELVKSRLDFMWVGDIHDEWELDCKIQHAPDVGEICVAAMEEAGRVLGFNVPLTGEYKIGESWAQTH